jgi:pectinesterase
MMRLFFVLVINLKMKRKMKFNLKKWFLTCCMSLFCLMIFAQQSIQEEPIEQMKWWRVATHLPAQWYGSEESKQVAENILLYQRDIGGWPKNIEMHRYLSPAQRDSLRAEKHKKDAIFDNNATTTEMLFLSKMYAKNRDCRYKEAFNRGLDFILAAQYPDNGGWPQFYPLKGRSYHDRITFNDEAITNLLRLLKKIYTRQPEFAAMVTPDISAKAKIAYDKGIQCILNCQIVKNGVKTVWCAQHDEHTFAPAYGRPFEHPSFSGAESVDIVQFLMEIENPDDRIKAAVIAAVEWFDSHRLKGIRVEEYTNDKGEKDRRIIDDPSAPDLWARFYHLESEVPIFGDYKTPPEILYNYSDIVVTSRRTGYDWYGSWAEPLIKEEYPAWKVKNNIK